MSKIKISRMTNPGDVIYAETTSKKEIRIGLFADQHNSLKIRIIKTAIITTLFISIGIIAAINSSSM